MASLNIDALITRGIFVIVLFFGTFGAWAVFSPLEGASIAPGVVKVDTERKTVQHLEGGIISKIMVSEGAIVNAGQPLIQLNQTRVQAELEQLTTAQNGILAKEARLVSERDNLAQINFPAELLTQADNLRVQELLINQVRIFEARNEHYLSQQNVGNKQLEQHKAKLLGQKKRFTFETKKRDLIKSEMIGNQSLAEKGYVSKTHVVKLQKDLTEAEGQLVYIQSEAKRYEELIAQTQAQQKEIELKRIKDIVEELRDTRQEKYGLEEQIASVQDVLNRTTITAPISGSVLNLQVFSEDGVISPGQKLLDIVPKDEKMVIEAQINPSDIDQITEGMKAQVRLTALSWRSLKPLDGELLTISADRLVDERTGAAYYLARVKFNDASQLANQNITVHPGMQAEVMLMTAARTPIEYLTKPLTESFNRAFREQ